jgi:hypothetical protein
MGVGSVQVFLIGKLEDGIIPYRVIINSCRCDSHYGCLLQFTQDKLFPDKCLWGRHFFLKIRYRCVGEFISFGRLFMFESSKKITPNKFKLDRTINLKTKLKKQSQNKNNKNTGSAKSEKSF